MPGIKHFSLDGFTLDPANRRLMRGEVPVTLPPKAFDTLVYLVEQAPWSPGDS